MSRVSVYVDGFNLYHGLKAAAYNSENVHKYLWLDIHQCVKFVLRDSTFNFVDIKYFTAEPFGEETCARHKIYCSALKYSGIQIIYGRYKRKTLRCNVCHNSFDSYEEKQTDINIALNLVNDAVQDLCDVVVLISGDTDLVPAIKLMKSLCPEKQCFVIFPPKRNRSDELRDVADECYELNKWHCRSCQFQDVITDSIRKPETWF